MDELLQNQERLQNEAKQVLEELNLMPVLSKIGKPQIVGSVALQVMTRKDIDIEILMDQISRQDIRSIVQFLAERPFPRIDFTIIDNISKESQNLPQGIYVGIKYAGKDKLIEKYRDNPKVWQIDCWFLKEENAQGSKITNEIKQRLTPESRKTILEIKHTLTSSPDYKGKYSGIDIYRAVLDKNVKTADDFINQLS